MWVLVLDASTGLVITNASFSITFYNQGNGYYYVWFSAYDEAFTCAAPGYYTLWATDDTYNGFVCHLAKIVPVPPPPPNCWS